MRAVDLHAHSTASDGSCCPWDLVAYAAGKGLSALALTDHDTADGLEEARQAGEELGIEVISGIEMTTVVSDCDVHIIGLYIDPHHPVMADLLLSMAGSRRARNRQMVARLEEGGYDIHLSDFAGYGDRAISRNHFAKLLVQRGYAKDRQDANTRFMLPGGLCYVRRETPSPEVCVDAIHKSGGLAFVAHINQIDPGDPDHGIAVCKRVLAAGADGLETKYCEYDAFWEASAEALAAGGGLLRSGGSDFHGDFKPGLDLMVGYGDLFVPYSYLEAIKARISAAR